MNTVSYICRWIQYPVSVSEYNCHLQAKLKITTNLGMPVFAKLSELHPELSYSCLLNICSTLQDFCEYLTRNIATGQFCFIFCYNQPDQLMENTTSQNCSPKKEKVTTGKISCIRTQDSMDSFKIANTAPRCYTLMPAWPEPSLYFNKICYF